MCFFAHTLEELREPSNPLDPVPKEGSGKGSRLSLDSVASAPFNLAGVPANSRRSVELPVSPQPPAQASSVLNNVQLPGGIPDAISHLTGANGTKVSAHELAAMLQQLTVSVGSQNIPNNDRIVQLLLMLLREIATARNHIEGQGVDGTGMAPTGLPRMSIDNHGLTRGTGTDFGFASSGAQFGADGGSLFVSRGSIPEHKALKDQVGRVSVEGLMSQYSSGVQTRGPSMDAVGAAAAAEAISMGFHGAGRVSVDGSLLSGLPTTRPDGPPSGLAYAANFLNSSRVAPGVAINCNIADGDGTLRTSSDSMESDETDMRRQSTDANLADVFILH